MHNIKFKRLLSKLENYELLFKWCQEDFVYEWFEQRKLSYKEVTEKYKNKINNSDQKNFLIYIEDIPIGYFQYYKSDYNNSMFEYDIFIGEREYLSKGYGTKIVNKINEYILKKEKCSAIVLRPFSKNIRAINTYIKCGYKVIEEYIGKDTIGNSEKITVMILSK